MSTEDVHELAPVEPLGRHGGTRARFLRLMRAGQRQAGPHHAFVLEAIRPSAKLMREMVDSLQQNLMGSEQEKARVLNGGVEHVVISFVNDIHWRQVANRA